MYSEEAIALLQCLLKCTMSIITMFADQKLIESRFIPDGHLRIEGYLQGLKNDMIEKNNDVIDPSKNELRFTVEPFPKRIVRN